MQIENLMLRRELFPIQVYGATGEKGRKFWSIDRVEIPPYHPSMAVTGLLFESVPDLLYESVEATVADLEEIADKRSDIQVILHDVVKDKKSRRVLFTPQIAKQDDFGIIKKTMRHLALKGEVCDRRSSFGCSRNHHTINCVVFVKFLDIIESVPIVDHFYVERKKINPYDYHGDQGITINLELSHSLFFVPEKVTFTPELMGEYEMTDKGLSLGERQIECPNGWYRHKLGTINAIFYKNLVISLNNEVVRRKYGRSKITEERGV